MVLKDVTWKPKFLKRCSFQCMYVSAASHHASCRGRLYQQDPFISNCIVKWTVNFV